MTRLHLAHPSNGSLLCGNPSTSVGVTTEENATRLTCLRVAGVAHWRAAQAAWGRAADLRRERTPVSAPPFASPLIQQFVATKLPYPDPKMVVIRYNYVIDPRPEGAEGVSCP